MSLVRYELLSTCQDDPSAASDGTRRYDNENDNNEEIELGNEHRRLKYQDDNAVNVDAEHLDDRYANGHAGGGSGGGGGSVIASSSNNVLHETGGLTSPTSHLPGSRFMQMAIGTFATILLYLTLSICLTFYQKALIKKLKFPLSIVTYHLVIKWLLSSGVRSFYQRRFGKSCVQLDWRTSVRKMAPTGIASGIDIGFSNWGLELVPISLYTMTKSTTIVFILIFAIFLGLEKKSWSLVFIVGLIATGLFMFTYKSTQFNALGFIFLLVASLSSGVRWSLAQFIMQKTKLGLHNPVDMIYHMQPWMIASLLPFLVAFEGQKLYDVLRDLNSASANAIYWVIGKITFGAVLAFFMEISEFMVLSKTSSLTLSIAGIFKDICQLALAVELNGDLLSVMNVFGLVVCLAGICCHLVHKYSVLTKMEELNALNDDLYNDYNETSISLNSGGGGSSVSGGGGMMGGSGHHHHQHNNHTSISVQNKKHSAQTVPLLEQTDSDDSNNDANEQNASDVIFDVLKRRDMQR